MPFTFVTELSTRGLTANKTTRAWLGGQAVLSKCESSGVLSLECPQWRTCCDTKVVTRVHELTKQKYLGLLRDLIIVRKPETVSNNIGKNNKGFLLEWIYEG